MVKRLLQCDQVDVNMQVILFLGNSGDGETSGDNRKLFDRNYTDIGKTTIIKIMFSFTRILTRGTPPLLLP